MGCPYLVLVGIYLCKDIYAVAAVLNPCALLTKGEASPLCEAAEFFKIPDRKI
jgi:hypothetical protein|tara:strand:+ start:139 stop:297 length:159 start_codon:yes stop_codon:yes gene_type:complete